MLDVRAVRRELHAHPELGFAETRTTELIVDQLTALGLVPSVLPGGTGVLCDVGAAGPIVALRADIDALPLQDTKDVPYRSRVDGCCHACGHDAHTAILLAAAAELSRVELAGRVRLIFQPAEETLPGGALAVIEAGGLDEVGQIFALHCDPRLDTGQVGLRVGAITAACDHLTVTLRGPGGHTARPQLTVDLVQALGRMATDLPAELARRVDAGAGLTFVWGAIGAGHAANAIPSIGTLQGTLRVLDTAAWDAAEAQVREIAARLAEASGAHLEVEYHRGMPPVVNDAGAVGVQQRAAAAANATSAETPQSMGGEDFAWYLGHVPGALARLGVRRPGGAAFDLHQGDFDIDEDALDVGVRYTVALAHAALDLAGLTP